MDIFTSVVRVIAGAYKAACGSLNVRDGAVVASYSRGESIYSVAADTIVVDGCVWAHCIAYSGAIRHVSLEELSVTYRNLY